MRSDEIARLLGRASFLCAPCQRLSTALCSACQGNAALVGDLRDALRQAYPDERCVFQIAVSLRLLSTSNARESWRRRADRLAEEKNIVRLHLAAKGGVRSPAWPRPLTIVLTRRFPPSSRAFDQDNAYASAKAPIDAVAAWLGVDDGDRDRAVWRVDQAPGPRHGLEIAVWCGGSGGEPGGPATL